MQTLKGVQLTGGSDSQWQYLRYQAQCASCHVNTAVVERVAVAGGEDPTGGGPWSLGSIVP